MEQCSSLLMQIVDCGAVIGPVTRIVVMVSWTGQLTGVGHQLNWL